MCSFVNENMTAKTQSLRIGYNFYCPRSGGCGESVTEAEVVSNPAPHHKADLWVDMLGVTLASCIY